MSYRKKKKVKNVNSKVVTNKNTADFLEAN